MRYRINYYWKNHSFRINADLILKHVYDFLLKIFVMQIMLKSEIFQIRQCTLLLSSLV